MRIRQRERGTDGVKVSVGSEWLSKASKCAYLAQVVREAVIIVNDDDLALCLREFRLQRSLSATSLRPARASGPLGRPDASDRPRYLPLRGSGPHTRPPRSKLMAPPHGFRASRSSVLRVSFPPPHPPQAKKWPKMAKKWTVFRERRPFLMASEIDFGGPMEKECLSRNTVHFFLEACPSRKSREAPQAEELYRDRE